MKPCFLTRVLPLAVVLLAPAGCAKETPPRSRDEIFRARLELPVLYFTDKTRKEVKAPGSKGMFVDPETGEVCWPALACHNPNCPGRQGDKLFLFIEKDPAYFAKPDGSVGYDRAREGTGQTLAGCPECMKVRNLQAETEAQRQEYISWVRPYVLPETAAGMKPLDEELQRTIALERAHRGATMATQEKAAASSDGQPTPADPATRPAG